MSGPRIFLYVQNLLGIGHVRRAGAVAKALSLAGFDVAFVSGGMPVPHLDIGGGRLFQLPPVRTRDQDFKTLIDETDRPIDEAWKAARRDKLLALFEEWRPAVLITELFPFGRRQMRFELLPLLDRAKTADWRPKIVSSMRDILVTKPREDRNREIAETVERYYDRLLIHGDASVISLAETYPLYGRVADRVAYTGYVVTPIDGVPDDGAGAGEILVSAGGGAVGRAYMQAVFEMRRDLPFQDRPWRFLAGHHMADDLFERMVAEQAPGLTVERSHPNLPALMSRAHLSISQAGYNTVMELMATGARAVVVPFEGGVETEQRLRADLLSRRGALAVVPESQLTLDRLGQAMREAAGRSRPNFQVELEGARRTAELIAELVRE